MPEGHECLERRSWRINGRVQHTYALFRQLVRTPLSILRIDFTLHVRCPDLFGLFTILHSLPLSFAVRDAQDLSDDIKHFLLHLFFRKAKLELFNDKCQVTESNRSVVQDHDELGFGEVELSQETLAESA